MRRDEALHLANHHYRLHSLTRPVVDCKPPSCMFASPKSRFDVGERFHSTGIHYVPFRQRPHQHASFETKPRGREELAQFLARQAHPQFANAVGFNAIARSNSALSMRDIDCSQNRPAQSRLLGSRVYQPPTRTTGHREKPPRPMASEQQPSRRIRLADQAEYAKFKERVIDRILLRGVFTDRIITDTFLREMEKRKDLDQGIMEDIMQETMRELDVSLPASTTKSVMSSAKSSGSLSSIVSSSSGQSSVLSLRTNSSSPSAYRV